MDSFIHELGVENNALAYTSIGELLRMDELRRGSVVERRVQRSRSWPSLLEVEEAVDGDLLKKLDSLIVGLGGKVEPVASPVEEEEEEKTINVSCPVCGRVLEGFTLERVRLLALIRSGESSHRRVPLHGAHERERGDSGVREIGEAQDDHWNKRGSSGRRRNGCGVPDSTQEEKSEPERAKSLGSSLPIDTPTRFKSSNKQKSRSLGSWAR